jgi:hypothetical protein
MMKTTDGSRMKTANGSHTPPIASSCNRGFNHTVQYRCKTHIEKT